MEVPAFLVNLLSMVVPEVCDAGRVILISICNCSRQSHACQIVAESGIFAGHGVGTDRTSCSSAGTCGKGATAHRASSIRAVPIAAAKRGGTALAI